jgi:hypothetical protein
MDNSDLTPPKAQSLSDAELEVALEQAKNQADGMLSAMVLLEQEAQLREQDERAFAAWVEKLTNDPRPEAQAALASALGRSPIVEPIEAEAVELPVVEPVVAEPTAVEEPEVSDPTPVDEPVFAQRSIPEPEPIPAPVTQDAAFDDLLASGYDSATDAITTVTDDFSVTGVVDQIVEKVETDFSASADEDATALEESAHTPVAAFEPEAPKAEKQPGRHKAAFDVFCNQIGLYAVAFPLVISAWALSTKASVSTVVIGSATGLLLAFGINLLALRAASHSEKTQTIISRATFGVFGNILPATIAAVSRIVVLVLLLAVGVSTFDSTISGVPEFASTVFGVNLGALVSVGFLLVSVLVASISVLRKYFARVTVTAALVWVVVAVASVGVQPINLGVADIGAVVAIALLMVAFTVSTLGLGISSLQLTGSQLNRAGVRVASLLATVVVPMVIVFGLSISVLSLPLTVSDVSSAFAVFAGSVPIWLATAALWVLIPALLLLIVQLFEFATESLQGLFISRGWLRSLIVATFATGIVVAGVFVPAVSEALSNGLVLALLGPAIWAGAYLTDSLMRHGDYHEVSLMRSYAFYKPVAVFAVIGYLALFGFGLGITDVAGLQWSGFLSRYLDSIVIFGNYSGIVLGFLGAAFWTLLTSLPRIRKQEREVAAVDERRSEIAGATLPE